MISHPRMKPEIFFRAKLKMKTYLVNCFNSLLCILELQVNFFFHLHEIITMWCFYEFKILLEMCPEPSNLSNFIYNIDPQDDKYFVSIWKTMVHIISNRILYFHHIEPPFQYIDIELNMPMTKNNWSNQSAAHWSRKRKEPSDKLYSRNYSRVLYCIFFIYPYILVESNRKHLNFILIVMKI